ncbi:MAG: hypothetical protein ABI832_15630, partial [bacterium]
DGFSLTLDHMLQLSSTQGQALNGTAGADLLVGTAGDDTITSSKGDDTIIGGNGNDVLVLNSNVGAFTLVVEGDGYRLTGTNTSDFLQGIEGISMDGGPVQLLDSLASPATLHLAVLGDMVDGAHAVKVQVDADPGTGVVIRGIATSSVLGLAMGLDGNSGLADYSVAAAGTHTGLGGATAAQKDGSLQQNQAVSSPSPLAGDPIAAALLVGSIAASVHGIIATGANDRFLGQSQNDVVNGAGGDDYLAGHGGRDILNGNSGRDVILGGNGHDVITGGKGHDVMTGGAGPDEFRFVTGDGYDRITDFSAGDRLNLVGQSIASHDALVAMARENAAGHLTIGDGPDSITLVGLHLSDLGWMDILI